MFNKFKNNLNKIINNKNDNKNDENKLEEEEKKSEKEIKKGFNISSIIKNKDILDKIDFIKEKVSEIDIKDSIENIKEKVSEIDIKDSIESIKEKVSEIDIKDSIESIKNNIKNKNKIDIEILKMIIDNTEKKGFFNDDLYTALEIVFNKSNNQIIDDILLSYSKTDYFINLDLMFSKGDFNILKEVYVSNDRDKLKDLKYNIDDKIQEIKNKVDNKKVYLIKNDDISMIVEDMYDNCMNSKNCEVKDNFISAIRNISFNGNYHWFYWNILFNLYNKESLESVLEEFNIFNEDMKEIFSKNENMIETNEFFKIIEFLKDIKKDKEEKIIK